MFADDADLFFFSHQNINTLFKIFHEELKKNWGLVQSKQVILK